VNDKKRAKEIKDFFMKALVEAELEERAAVVAWLRSQSQLTLYEATPDDVADAIERGEHVKEKP